MSSSPSSFVDFNFSSSLHQNNQGATGFVVLDDHGHHLSEALALPVCLHDALIHSFTKTDVEDDSKILMDCINNAISVSGRI